jgi:hypothetical protein
MFRLFESNSQHFMNSGNNNQQSQGGWGNQPNYNNSGWNNQGGFNQGNYNQGGFNQGGNYGGGFGYN